LAFDILEREQLTHVNPKKQGRLAELSNMSVIKYSRVAFSKGALSTRIGRCGFDFISPGALKFSIPKRNRKTEKTIPMVLFYDMSVRMALKELGEIGVSGASIDSLLALMEHFKRCGLVDDTNHAYIAPGSSKNNVAPVSMRDSEERLLLKTVPMGEVIRGPFWVLVTHHAPE